MTYNYQRFLLGKVKLTNRVAANAYISLVKPGLVPTVVDGSDPARIKISPVLDAEYVVFEDELVALFDEVTAWKVQKITMPINFNTETGELTSEDTVGDYGLFLTTDGVFLLKGAHGLSGQGEAVEQDFFRTQYQETMSQFASV